MLPRGTALGLSRRASATRARAAPEGDLGRQRGFPHAGPSRQDHQVGGVQAAHLAVEVAQAGREP